MMYYLVLESFNNNKQNDHQHFPNTLPYDIDKDSEEPRICYTLKQPSFVSLKQCLGLVIIGISFHWGGGGGSNSNFGKSNLLEFKSFQSPITDFECCIKYVQPFYFKLELKPLEYNLPLKSWWVFFNKYVYKSINW